MGRIIIQIIIMSLWATQAFGDNPPACPRIVPQEEGVAGNWVLRPCVVETTEYLGSHPNGLFSGNNESFLFPGGRVGVSSGVLNLPSEPDLRAAMGPNVCNSSWRLSDLYETVNGVRQLSKEYCRWAYHGGEKTVGRFFRARFNREAIPGIPLKEVVVTVINDADKKTGFHIFTTEVGEKVWDHQIYCEIGPHENEKVGSGGSHYNSKECSFALDQDYILDQVIVARARWGANAGYLTVRDVYAKFDPVPRSDTLLLTKNIQGQWKPASNIQEMLNQNNGFLSADIKLANGKTMTITLGNTKCLADGKPGTPIEEYTRGKPTSEVKEIAQIIEGITGQKMTDEVADLLNGRRSSADKKAIGLCDNTDRCKQGQDILNRAGAINPNDMGNISNIFNPRAGGTPKEYYMEGVSSDDKDKVEQAVAKEAEKDPKFWGDQKKAAEEFLNRAQQGDSATKANVSNGAGGGSTDIIKFDNGPSRVESHGDRTEGVPKVMYLPSDKNAQAAARELIDKAPEKERGPVSKEGINQIKAEIDIAARSQRLAENNIKKTCSLDDEKCMDKKTRDRMKKGLEPINQLLASRGLAPIIIDSPSLSSLVRGINRVSGPNYNLDKSLNQARRNALVNPGPGDRDNPGGLDLYPEPSCLLFPKAYEICVETQRIHCPKTGPEDIIPLVNPGPDGELPSCPTNNCQKSEIAAGHFCGEPVGAPNAANASNIPDRLSASTAPKATCGQNVYNGSAGAIDCSQDNPNCGPRNPPGKGGSPSNPAGPVNPDVNPGRPAGH